MIKNCVHCTKEYEVKPAKFESSKFCGVECKNIHLGLCRSEDTECTNCKKMFYIKPSSKKRYKRTLGYFCSNVCVAEYKSSAYGGDKNPNYRACTTDQDGYPVRIFPDACSRVGGLRRMKVHQAVCCEILGVSRLPKGVHVHHRDCDIMNNRPENLSVLSASDHKWIHKQYGNATLWAHSRNLVQTDQIVSWSDDKKRAEDVLSACVTSQSIDRIAQMVVQPCMLGATIECATLPSTDRGDRGFGSTGV